MARVQRKKKNKLIHFHSISRKELSYIYKKRRRFLFSIYNFSRFYNKKEKGYLAQARVLKNRAKKFYKKRIQLISSSARKKKILDTYLKSRHLFKKSLFLKKKYYLSRVFREVADELSQMDFHLNLSGWKVYPDTPEIWLEREEERKRRQKKLRDFFFVWLKGFVKDGWKAKKLLETFDLKRSVFLSIFRFPAFDRSPLKHAQLSNSWLLRFHKSARELSRLLESESYEEEYLLINQDRQENFNIQEKIRQWITFKVTQNNVFLTIINNQGEVMLWQSAGSSGFRGPRRSTPYAARVTGYKFGVRLVNKLIRQGEFRKVSLFGLMMKEGLRRKTRMLLQGFFNGLRRSKWARETGKLPGVRVQCIIRKESISHNGMRKRKPRRV